MPRFRAWSWNAIDENMLPCSVTASAGISSLDGLVEQLLDAAGAVEQRILRVQVQVDELGHEFATSFPLPASRSPLPLDPELTPTGSWRRVAGSLPCYSHSIVDGGFELMS